ncbi:hypothetical protein GPALN_009790 [Globodera pallida]|nr:hypothetical protein GPALN_009790 [Globodera pallida]
MESEEELDGNGCQLMMASGERVYESANRLNEVVRTVLSGESEGAIQKRLLEKFLVRLSPDLQFEEKSGRPTDYTRTYELAQHFELLFASKRETQISVADLSSKVEALATQQQVSFPNWLYRIHCLLYLLRSLFALCSKLDRYTKTERKEVLNPKLVLFTPHNCQRSSKLRRQPNAFL